MTTVVKKLDDGYGVKFSDEITTKFNLSEGSIVKITTDETGIKINLVDKKEALKKMLKGLTKEQLHGEISTGYPVGKEVW
jgi:antitoxin MazE